MAPDSCDDYRCPPGPLTWRETQIPSIEEFYRRVWGPDIHKPEFNEIEIVSAREVP